MITGRIKKRSQFLDITNNGHKALTKSFVVFCRFDYFASDTVDVLCGLTVSRKNGNAVRRNRIKRRLRHMLQDISNDIQIMVQELNILSVWPIILMKIHHNII